MISKYFTIFFVFAFVLIVEIQCKDDSADVVGYGIYEIYVKTEEEANILEEMAKNKIITRVGDKKDPFKWRVIVRATNEPFMQKKLVEIRMSYVIIKSSPTAQPDELGQRSLEEYYSDQEGSYKQNDDMSSQGKHYPYQQHAMPPGYPATMYPAPSHPSPGYQFQGYPAVGYNPYCSPHYPCQHSYYNPNPNYYNPNPNYYNPNPNHYNPNPNHYNPNPHYSKKY